MTVMHRINDIRLTSYFEDIIKCKHICANPYTHKFDFRIEIMLFFGYATTIDSTVNETTSYRFQSLDIGR